MQTPWNHLWQIKSGTIHLIEELDVQEMAVGPVVAILGLEKTRTHLQRVRDQKKINQDQKKLNHKDQKKLKTGSKKINAVGMQQSLGKI